MADDTDSPVHSGRRIGSGDDSSYPSTLASTPAAAPSSTVRFSAQVLRAGTEPRSGTGTGAGARAPSQDKERHTFLDSATDAKAPMRFMSAQNYDDLKRQAQRDLEAGFNRTRSSDEVVHRRCRLPVTAEAFDRSFTMSDKILHLEAVKKVSWWERLLAIFTFTKPEKRAFTPDRPRVLFGLLAADTYELLEIMFMASLELFRVTLATLLAIFVPQLCPGDPPDTTPGHTCSTDENLHQLTNFNQAVVVWNFLTLSITVLHYFIVLKREEFLVHYFDQNPKKPEFYLPQMLPKYKEIGQDLHRMNLIVFISSCTTMVVFFINCILSGILVFRDYYNGYQTVTVYLTNIGLLTTVIQKTLLHAWVGMQRKVALSCIDSNPVSFNSVDLKYLLDEDLEPEQLDQVRKLQELNTAGAAGAAVVVDFHRESVMEQP